MCGLHFCLLQFRLHAIRDCLVELHQFLLVPEFVREVEKEPSLQPGLVCLLSGLLRLRVHPQVEVAARQVDPHGLLS